MRDNRIDILRFIGLAMVIFAHVGPPRFLFQLRNFDVPLMVLVSGMSFGYSYKDNVAYLTYIWKRVKRVVFPVWIFLMVYFLVLFLFFPDSSELEANIICSSFFLTSGIGYVWIIRVFLLVALVSPFIYLYNKKIESHYYYLLSLTIFFAVYELVRYLSVLDIESSVGTVVNLVIPYVVPYSILFALGLRIPSLNKRQMIIVSIFNLGLFIVLGAILFLIFGEFKPTQALKYPPSTYYFSYSIFVSCILWGFSLSIEKIFKKIKLLQMVLFIAQNSIWIYLWHIPFVKIPYANFALKYVIVFSISVAIVYCQVWLVNNVFMNLTSSVVARKNMKILLTG